MNSIGTSSTEAGQPSLKQPARKGWMWRTGLLPWLLPLLAVAIVAAGVGWADFPAPVQAQAATADYDADDDGLMEVSTLLQLQAIGEHLDGDEVKDVEDADYSSAFPNPATDMGCGFSPDAAENLCLGYELTIDLDFDTNADSVVNSEGEYSWDGAKGTGFAPIWDVGFELANPVEYRFDAISDGNGFTIFNLTFAIHPRGIAGLTGATGETSIIRNVGLINANVPGDHHIGALVGDDRGVIVNSFATGNVLGDHMVGGLVGINGNLLISGTEIIIYSASTVASYSSANMDASNPTTRARGIQNEGAGGLAGANHGVITGI